MNISFQPEKPDNRFMFYFLSNTPSIGSASILKLYDYYTDLSVILSIDKKELISNNILKPLQIDDLVKNRSNYDLMYREYQYMTRKDIQFITYMDDCYPEKLKNISSPPAVLYVKGELPDPLKPSAAIVGSRASTSYGNSAAGYFGEILANEGINIISGMARGIDGAAHRGALNAKEGKTYCVLGGGVNVVYPRESIDIYEAAANCGRGGIISEMPPGTNAISRNFPMRNRIISGLADVVIIVEAREKSGSLITADLALEQGKDILAVPGRITDPMSKGCNQLINAGARIANSPDDVLELLNLSIHGQVRIRDKNTKLLANNEKIVYSTLDSAPKHTEEIVYLTGLPIREVISALVELELKGFVTQISSNYYGTV